MDEGEHAGAAAVGRGSHGWVPQKDLPANIQVLLASRLPWNRWRGARMASVWISEHRLPPQRG